MRSRRTRTRFQRTIPKPELVITEAAPQAAAPLGNMRPSRAREREAYVATAEDNAAVVTAAEELLESTGVEFSLRFEPGDYQRVFVDVGEDHAGALIGKRGAGISALETLVGRMASHRTGHPIPVRIDINEYWVRHEDGLRSDALELAKRVQETGQDEHLQSMNARERRIVHLAIEKIDGLETYSVGEGVSKHIVIRRD